MNRLPEKYEPRNIHEYLIREGWKLITMEDRRFEIPQEFLKVDGKITVWVIGFGGAEFAFLTRGKHPVPNANQSGRPNYFGNIKVAVHYLVVCGKIFPDNPR